MYFYLGTHEPTWLRKSHVPLFISAIRLEDRCKRKLPKAVVPWALDSGGFSVVTTHGRHLWTPEEYAAKVRRWRDEIGLLDWAAVQDWMCEEIALNRSGLTIEEHQRRTVQSWVDLRRIAPDLPWLPVIQGFTRDEYFRCVELYREAGTDLRDCGIVGIGSVCRREDTKEAEQIVKELSDYGIRLHGFGFKVDGVKRVCDSLVSSDSLAWSFGARQKANQQRKAMKNRTPSLFDEDATAVKGKQNDAGEALLWCDKVRQSAGIIENAGALCCPFCQSGDVHPPLSDVDYSCVECGETWGDMRCESLASGPFHVALHS